MDKMCTHVPILRMVVELLQYSIWDEITFGSELKLGNDKECSSISIMYTVFQPLGLLLFHF